MGKYHFKLCKSEIKQVDDWIKKHNEECTCKDQTTIGGKYTFNFTPTGIGLFISVKCACGISFIVDTNN